MISSSVAASDVDRAGAGHVADRAVADGLRSNGSSPSRQLDGLGRRRAACRRARRPRARGRSRSTAPRGPRARCTARRRARSSWRSGRRACARPCGCGRCRGSTARAAGSSGPTGRTRRGSEKTRSLARAFSSSRRAPPKAASNCAPRSRRAASSSAAGCATRAARSPRHAARCRSTPGREATISRSPSSATRRSRNSSTSGKLWPVSTCMTGNGNRAGPERLLGQAQQDDRVLAAGEQQHGPLELGGDLAHDVDRLGLERVEVGELVGHTRKTGSDFSPMGAGARLAGPCPTYRPEEYWQTRLRPRRFSLGGVGHQDYSDAYNAWLYRAKRRALRRGLPGSLAERRRALDVGSGVGWVVASSARLASPPTAWTSRRRWRSSGSPPAFPTPASSARRRHRPACRWRTAGYDIVTLLDVAYHVTDDARLRRGRGGVWPRSPRPGGRLLVTDALGAEDRRPAPHVRFRSRAAWEAAAGRGGAAGGPRPPALPLALPRPRPAPRPAGAGLGRPAWRTARRPPAPLAA